MSAHASPESSHQEHGEGHGHGHHEAPREPKVYRIGIDAEDFTFTFPNPDGELVQFFNESPDDAWYVSLAVQDPEKFQHDNLPPGLKKVKERLIELGFDFDNPFAQGQPFGTSRPDGEEAHSEHTENGHTQPHEEVLEAEIVEEAQAASENEPEEIVIEDENSTTNAETEDSTQEKLRTPAIRNFFKKVGRSTKTTFRTIRKATVPKVTHAGIHKVGDVIDAASTGSDSLMSTIDEKHDTVTDKMRESIEQFPFIPGIQIEHGIRETLLSADIAADNATRAIESGIDTSKDWMADKYRAAVDAIDDKVLQIMDFWLVQYGKLLDRREIRRRAKQFNKVKKVAKKGARRYEKELDNLEIDRRVRANVAMIKRYLKSKHPTETPRYRKYEQEKASWPHQPLKEEPRYGTYDDLGESPWRMEP